MRDDALQETPFGLVLVRDEVTGAGALGLIAPSQIQVLDYIRRLEVVMFPQAGQSESELVVWGPPVSDLEYTITGPSGSAKIEIAAIPDGAESLVRSSLNSVGGVALLFGYGDIGNPTFLSPETASIVRHSSVVDGTKVTGVVGHDWSQFMETIETSFDAERLDAE